MKILLDTHAFLWWLDEDPKLSEVARATIANESNEILFSVASSWELAIKTQAGKLNLSEDFIDLIPYQMRVNNFTILSIELTHTLHVHTLPLHHRDPFDRIMIAQCQIENIPILTVDAQISKYEVSTIW